MRQRLRPHLSFANVCSALALFIALTGTATATVIITSNSQVAKNTISGHNPPTGDHANLIGGSVNGPDLAAGAVTSAKVANHSLGSVDYAVAKLSTTLNVNNLPKDSCQSTDLDAPGSKVGDLAIPVVDAVNYTFVTPIPTIVHQDGLANLTLCNFTDADFGTFTTDQAVKVLILR